MKKINLLIIILLSVFISGCISLDINQEIKKDGTSSIELVYDLSSIIDSMAGSDFDDGFTFEIPEEDDFCLEMIENNPSIISDCTSERLGVYKLYAEYDVSEHLTIKNGLFSKEYIFDAISVFNFLELLEDDGETITQASLSEMRMLNPSLSYNIIMPAEIVKADVGRVSGSSVRINLFDLEREEQVLITAKEQNYLFVFILVGVFVLIVFFVIFFYIKNKSKKSPVENVEGISQEEENSKKYILDYKNSYSKDSIKEALVSGGVSSSDADKYISKYY